MDTGPDTHRLPEDGFPAADGLLLPEGELTPLPLPEPGTLEFRERELRPERKLRLWQILPIAALAILGSLMFAFPLAFEGGGGNGSVVGMLGLLLTAASAGWGAMAARRAGYAWPGLPRQGSGRRAGWRVLLAYTAVAVVLLGLGAWRVSLLGN